MISIFAKKIIDNELKVYLNSWVHLSGQLKNKYTESTEILEDSAKRRKRKESNGIFIEVP